MAGLLEYDFEGVTVGVAEDPQGPTGVTVITLPDGSRTAVDTCGPILGLSSGAPNPLVICLAGGGVRGLAAAAGVGGRAAVSAAAINDFSGRTNQRAPDAELGRAATLAAQPGRARYGRVGAGAGASVGAVNADGGGGESGGQGVAFRAVGPLKVLVVTVVNGLGVLIDRKGVVVRGNLRTAAGSRRHPVADYAQRLFDGAVPELDGGGGTLTVAVTNAVMGDSELAAFGRQVHASMARAISPFHTAADSDVLFAVTTNGLALRQPSAGRWAATASATAAIASETAWDAVLRSFD